MKQDYLVKATLYDGYVRAYAATTTNLVEEARRRQDTWATATAALGRTLTVTSLMTAMLKNKDSITVKVEGDGPLQAIVTDGNAKGDVRGYVINPHVDFPLNESGKLDVKRAVGTEGHVSVVKDLGLKEYFTGQVPLISGEISEDFTYYFASSEQVPSSVGAGVLVNPDHSVLAAGGFIIQLLPGADDAFIDELEKTIESFPPISSLVENGYNPEQILQRLFKDETIKFHETERIRFHCQCSRARMLNAIQGLGKKEIKEMIEEDGGAEATCHFCNEVYQVSKEELNQLIE